VRWLTLELLVVTGLAVAAADVPPVRTPNVEEKTAVPEPLPPVYTTLKALHLETPLVRAGRPETVVIVPADGRYQAAAEMLIAAVARRSGVTLRLVADTDPAAALPLTAPAIVLGNRSTNRTLSALYDGFYTLLDLKYPGPGGSVVQSLHNPFGNGINAILVGGSDAAGVQAAAARGAALIEALPARAGNDLTLGWIADIRLGEGRVPPEKVADARVWEESRFYGSSGYFGWNVISKAMALYYMTGEARFADEFLRLAFPDAAAIKEIEELDGERIENKLEPLAGPYHYSAHMMILFWDLIEESPRFTDEIRLKVSNAFSRQLRHRAVERVYGLRTPPAYVGDRHRDWSATSLYVLARYFGKDYPDPVWTCSLESCRIYYSALRNSPWLAGANDHLFWYTSYYDPIVDYMILSGDRSGLDQGHLAEALRTQDVLFTGSENDWGLKASSLNFLQRTAYLAGDGRWLFYRQQTGISTEGLRLGQSFWTDTLAPRPPTELLQRWTLQAMPKPLWQTRGSGIPLEESFLWGSFRSALDRSGDYVLVKGHNGGGRNPHHTFALLEFRLAGNTLLKGYGTQVQTRADGMVEPVAPMDAALKRADVLGRSAWVVGEVPRLPFCTWRRSLLLRSGAWAVIADRLDYRADSANLARQTSWETVGGAWDAERRAVVFRGNAAETALPGWTLFPALASPCTSRPSNDDAARSLIDLPTLGIRMVKAMRPGDYIEQTFTLAAPFEGEVHADLLHYSDRGFVRLLLDGREVVAECDHYASAAVPARLSLGPQRLAVGPHVLRVEARRCREGLDRCYIGLSGVALQAKGAAAAAPSSAFMLCPADAEAAQGSGLVRLDWSGPVKAGERQTDFTLLASTPDATRQPLSCRRLAPEAVALRTPQAALALAGSYAGSAGEMVVVTAEGVSARGLTALALAGLALRAEPAADVDWDWSGGTLLVACRVPTRLAFTSAAAVRLAGRETAPVDGLVSVDLPVGEHRLEAARPAADTVTAVAAALNDLCREASAAPPAVAPAAALARTAATALKALFAVDCGAPIVALEAGGDRLYAASAREITGLDRSGAVVGKMSTQGDIRALHWWPEAGLLLAGCADEKVLAFRPDGTIAWTFVSEMDRAVWEAAKQYWFKSASPGIYGLDTGAFLEGGTQCFVGSACTLEILAANGTLSKRLPVFWGPGWRFAIRQNRDASRDLLIAQQPTDSHTLAIVNNKTLAVTGAGFGSVPAGHTEVTGWATMSRDHIVLKDLDGDGQPEVVSEINGFWNRITVWGLDGQARYNAQIGPGKSIPYRNVRDLAVEDLDGDGRCEIAVALDSGLLTVLDCTLQRRWSKAMPTPPNCLRALPAGTPGAGVLYVACDGGQVLLFDALGKVLAEAVVRGRPVAECAWSTGAQAGIALGTAAGQVIAYGAAP
jgi:hypothetical protein